MSIMYVLFGWYGAVQSCPVLSCPVRSISSVVFVRLPSTPESSFIAQFSSATSNSSTVVVDAYTIGTCSSRSYSVPTGWGWSRPTNRLLPFVSCRSIDRPDSCRSIGTNFHRLRLAVMASSVVCVLSNKSLCWLWRCLYARTSMSTAGGDGGCVWVVGAVCTTIRCRVLTVDESNRSSCKWIESSRIESFRPFIEKRFPSSVQTNKTTTVLNVSEQSTFCLFCLSINWILLAFFSSMREENRRHPNEHLSNQFDSKRERERLIVVMPFHSL